MISHYTSPSSDVHSYPLATRRLAKAAPSKR